jgi:hypothetical protein
MNLCQKKLIGGNDGDLCLFRALCDDDDDDDDEGDEQSILIQSSESTLASSHTHI